MIREVTATGRDVNEAIERGCTELGVDRDDAQFEIISLPRKTFLGLKIIPAKVRVYQELPDPVIAPPAPAPKPTPAPRPAPAAPKQPQTLQQKPAAAPASAKKPAAAPAPQQRTAPANQSQRQNSGTKPAASAEISLPQKEIIPTEDVRTKVEKAAEYLADIMRAMGFEGVEVKPVYYEENVCLQLDGAQMGVVIGRRGETLDALQYLTSLVANRGDGEYIRINIDSGNYREKREKTLTALARKLALQAVRTGKSTTLEPMNPYERRVIHGAVSQIRGASSTSVGADPNRRVVISCSDPSKVRGGDTERTGDGGGTAKGSRDRRERRDGTRPHSTSTGVPRPLRPNTNVAPSADASGSVPTVQFRPNTNTAPTVTRTDDGNAQHTAAFTATAPRAVAKQDTAPQGKKLSDAEMFADIPVGVPIIHGDKSAAPKVQAPKPEARAPKKLDGELYGKI